MQRDNVSMHDPDDWEYGRKIMLHKTITTFLLAMLLFFIACSDSSQIGIGREEQTAAREELEQLNIAYNSLEFIKAATRGDVHTVELFLDAGMNPNATATQAGREPAMWHAANNGRLEVMELLLDRGADLDARYNFGYTILMKAAFNDYAKVVEFMLDKGADPNIKNEFGGTPLMFAAGLGGTEVVQLLLDKGVDVNAVDENGKTALMYAAKEGRTENVRLLKQAGAKK